MAPLAHSLFLAPLVSVGVPPWREDLNWALDTSHSIDGYPERLLESAQARSLMLTVSLLSASVMITS